MVGEDDVGPASLRKRGQCRQGIIKEPPGVGGEVDLADAAGQDTALVWLDLDGSEGALKERLDIVPPLVGGALAPGAVVAVPGEAGAEVGAQVVDGEVAGRVGLTQDLEEGAGPNAVAIAEGAVEVPDEVVGHR